MKIKILTLTIAFLTASQSIHGDEFDRSNYTQLRRLLSVIDLPSFPPPSQDGIQAWKQETGTRGVANEFDFNKFPFNTYEEMPVSTFVKFYGGKAMNNDLANVVIISDNGRSIRFVNLERQTEGFALRRGDVVAFLRK